MQQTDYLKEILNGLELAMAVAEQKLDCVSVEVEYIDGCGKPCHDLDYLCEVCDTHYSRICELERVLLEKNKIIAELIEKINGMRQEEIRNRG